MSKGSKTCRYMVLAVLGYGLVLTNSVYAQNNRSAVSVTGSDAATCTVPDPCRAFSAAISKTNPNGEILVLSSGGYGPFLIDRAVSIISPPGIYAGITATTGIGITVNAGASAVVLLRGLTINGLGGLEGIDVTSAAALLADKLFVRGFSYAGLYFETNGQVTVKDSTFMENSSYGIVLWPAGPEGIKATVDRCILDRHTSGGAGYGIYAVFDVYAIVRDTIASNNNVGFRGYGSSTSAMGLENCVAVNNGVGVEVQNGGIIRVSQTTVLKNTTGILPTFGEIRSFGNNRLAGNQTDGTFSATIALK